MKFKTNPYVVCNVCGATIYYRGGIKFSKEVMYFKCSSSRCEHSKNGGKGYELDKLPEWVVRLDDVNFDDANLTDIE